MKRRIAVLLLSGLAMTGLALTAAAGAVVGGRPARGADYPFLAYVGGCGGSLIAPDRVLTAAHCVSGRSPADIGTIEFGNGERRTPIRVAIAPGFAYLPNTRHREATSNDAAIVALDRPVAGVSPIAISTEGLRPTRSVRIVGSGATSPPPRRRAAASAIPNLHQATVRTISDGACARYWGRYANARYHRVFDRTQMLCAADPRDARPDHARTVCAGDSGGPLLVRAGPRWRLAGVAAWTGDRCGNDPSVYADGVVFRAFATAADPVWAPAPGPEPTRLTGEARVGGTLTCTGPSWTPDTATVTYRFTSYRYRRKPRKLQDGPSPTYVVQSADRLRQITCEPVGTTPGGSTGAALSPAARIP